MVIFNCRIARVEVACVCVCVCVRSYGVLTFLAQRSVQCAIFFRRVKSAKRAVTLVESTKTDEALKRYMV
jgi:hypothetical protein